MSIFSNSMITYGDYKAHCLHEQNVHLWAWNRYTSPLWERFVAPNTPRGKIDALRQRIAPEYTTSSTVPIDFVISDDD